MKLIVAQLRDKPIPGKSPLLNVSLDKRVSYALDVIEAEESHADEARNFLTKIMHRIDDPELQAKVAEALGHPMSQPATEPET